MQQINGPWESHVRSAVARERQILYGIAYMWNLTKPDSETEESKDGHQGPEERGWVKVVKGTTSNCKVSQFRGSNVCSMVVRVNYTALHRLKSCLEGRS